MPLVGGGGAGNTAGGNPAGISKSLAYMGGDTWAGWSGLVLINNSTVEMFNFVTPSSPLIVNFQYYMDHSAGSPGSNEYVGWILTIDGSTIIRNILKATTLQHYNDFDPNTFVLPANSTCKIESYTNQDENIYTSAVMTCKQIGGN